MNKFRVRIKRQDNEKSKPYWEEWDVPYSLGMNVITVLQEIQKNPVNIKGEKTKPVVWECNCLEEVCGACSMVINGIPRQACSALVDNLKKPITLKPFSKFPVKRDLIVDRGVMFENLIKVKAWISIDGSYYLGYGPKMSKKEALEGYNLSRCMTCGCCMEGCPQVNKRTKFMGPPPIAQVKLFNLHPTGKMRKDDRLKPLLEDGGISECGNAQNCERLCPKEIKLLSAIAEINRDAVKYFIKGALKS